MKVRLLAGVAGLSLSLGFVGAATAQEAAPQQAAQDCSGLGCIFGGPRQPSPAEARALQDNQRAAQAAAAADSDTKSSSTKGNSPKGGSDKTRRVRTAHAARKGGDSTSQGSTPQTASNAPDASDDAAKSTKKVATRPVHTVTIAADGPEVKRLERLVAALPKEKIKIVKARNEGDRTKSDFTVAASLESNGGGETAKLFTEQMHIVAGGAVHSVADLDGKVVSFGPDKSPGQITARKAFEALHIKVDETPLDVDNALDGLSTGDIDAVVILAPQPVDRLKTVKGAGVHLVSWPEGGTLPSGANAATIDAGAYPSLAKPGETIRAVGVDATLTISAKGARQGAAKSFLKSLSHNADALTRHGFDLLKADLESRNGRRLASADKS